MSIPDNGRHVGSVVNRFGQEISASPMGASQPAFEVERLMAPNIVLSAPAALRILGPKVAQRALKFISKGTIGATPVDKILLDGEPSSRAVDALLRAVEQVSHNAQPPACPTTVNKEDRTPNAGGHCPAATSGPANLLTNVANPFGETLPAVNEDVSIIESSPFPRANAPLSLKIGVLCKVHPCRGLVIDFPEEELISSENDDEE
uniref:Uncharacterized protein n=1 Tax=Romanomermis culicivorax TaxID=13658 RepID=A0A915KRN5_ROMCU